MNILSNPFSKMDEISTASLKQVTDRIIERGYERVVNEAMEINSYSADLLSIDVITVTQAGLVLFNDINSYSLLFFVDAFSHCDFGNPENWSFETDYKLTIIAFFATLPQEDIDELINYYHSIDPENPLAAN